jgi:hypothetical protein
MAAIETTLKGGAPKGIVNEKRADEIIRLHSFAGMRPRGT